FFMVLRFHGYLVTAHVFANCYRLKKAKMGFFSFVPCPCAPPQDKGTASLVSDLRRESLFPRDKQLFVSSLFILCGSVCVPSSNNFTLTASIYEELSSRSLGTPPVPSNDTQKRKLEDSLECLGSENAKLMETKKEVMGSCQQSEREVK
ncbi:UNVERIFIED_CONTAM: hypothetical protein Sindi_1382900, partial [Sesamum indicum]